MEGMNMPYSVIKTAAGNTNGGIRALMPDEPPNWLVYLGTDDIEQSAARVGELGGATLAGPFSIGPGKIAIVRDPQGGVFALYSGEFDG
jgi:predicted enzyme related to lactoylglutathione lyase